MTLTILHNYGLVRTLAVAFFLSCSAFSLKAWNSDENIRNCGNEERDVRIRTYISPARIVWQSDAGVQLADVLLKPGNGQAYCNNDTPTSYCILSSENGAAPGVLLDYGKELHGGLQIVTGWFPGGPVKVRVRYGESASEAMSDVGGKGGATNDHAMRDQVISLPMMGAVEIGNSGYRFVRIDLAEPDRTVKLKEVRAISIMRDLDYAGTFRCSDERLNRIWETGAYTVHLCMQNFLIEGIKRDRLVWIGDSYPEVMTVATVFGGNEVVPKTLDWMRDVTPLPNWMNGEFSSYSIWWMLCHQAWFRHTGNKDYLLESKEYISGLLRQLIGCVGSDGREHLDGIRFLDWPSQENELAKNVGLQALMVWAMRAGQEFAEIFGDEALAAECADAEKRLSKVAPKIYKEFLKSGVSPDSPGSKQAAALMTLSGLTDAKKADADILAYNGGHGFSTFYGYLMLEAMARACDWQGALDIIRGYWGAMLDLGATTFWEDFNLDWLPNAAGIDELVPEGKKDIHGDFGAYCYQGFRHSLCHGWASGPTAWLSHHVLGVEILEPGCAKVRITPHLGDLEWAEGSFPTPYGAIRIRHERLQDGRINTVVDAPAGVTVID